MVLQVGPPCSRTAPPAVVSHVRATWPSGAGRCSACAEAQAPGVPARLHHPCPHDRLEEGRARPSPLFESDIGRKGRWTHTRASPRSGQPLCSHSGVEDGSGRLRCVLVGSSPGSVDLRLPKPRGHQLTGEASEAHLRTPAALHRGCLVSRRCQTSRRPRQEGAGSRQRLCAEGSVAPGPLHRPRQPR